MIERVLFFFLLVCIYTRHLLDQVLVDPVPDPKLNQGLSISRDFGNKIEYVSL